MAQPGSMPPQEVAEARNAAARTGQNMGSSFYLGKGVITTLATSTSEVWRLCWGWGWKCVWGGECVCGEGGAKQQCKDGSVQQGPSNDLTPAEMCHFLCSDLNHEPCLALPHMSHHRQPMHAALLSPATSTTHCRCLGELYLYKTLSSSLTVLSFPVNLTLLAA